ncbi:MAG: carbon-nitrogen hydrolase family protein [Thermodesulfobacteriota bacterium]
MTTADSRRWKNKFRLWRNIILTILLVAAVYLAWCVSGRTPPEISPQMRLEEVLVLGQPSDRGNILGVQPFMEPSDYASEDHFRLKLETYLKAAKDKEWLGPRTVVLYPEYIGAWLVAAGEKASIYTETKAEAAMTTLVLGNPLLFLRTLAQAPPVQDKVKYCLFRMKAERMARIYENVFSTLAGKYGLTIIAGSILLPSPDLRDGRLNLGSGPLYNVTAIFGPDGKIIAPLVKKAFPISDELPFLAPGRVEEIPVFDLAIGRTGVLICADSWYPPGYEVLARQGVKIIVVPSFLTSDGAMKRKWPGYNGAPAPADVDRADQGVITEAQAWLKYSLAQRIKSTSAAAGLNVFLKGRLWDLGADGFAIAVREGQVTTGRETSGASLICLWL